MKSFVLYAVVLLVSLISLKAEAAGHSFARRDFIAALADTPDVIIPVPEDSNCCDDTSQIEGKMIIPGSRIDSLMLSLPEEKRFRQPNPTRALFLSMFIPGGGQIYNRDYIKAAIYGGTQVYLVKYIAWRWKWMNRHKSNFQSTEDEIYKAEQFALFEKMQDSRNLHIWLLGLTTLISMFDAYVDAHLADFDQTDKAFEVYLGPDEEAIILNLVYSF